MTRQVTETVDGILAFLKKENLLDQTEEIAQMMISRVVADKTKVIVESAKQLNEQEAAEITEMLKQNWGGFEIIEFVVNPELLGGLKVSMGDKVLDLSVKSRLEKVYEQI